MIVRSSRSHKKNKMNKEQEKIAEDLISFLKKNEGVAHNIDISKNIQKLQKGINSTVVIGELKERNLIRDSGRGGEMLTEKGWSFKSFKKLKYAHISQKIKNNISFVLNIILIVCTIYITAINNNLSEKNSALKENILDLQVRLSVLETKINYFETKKNMAEVEQNKSIGNK